MENNTSLIHTSSFKYGKYPFEHFNYLQSLCFPFHDQDTNLVVAASTSSGKTIVAEQNIAHVISQGKKAIFLSPLKAVTSEKFDDWTDDSHFLSQFKVEILTGDHKLTPAKIKSVQDSNLVLLTSEMLDTRTRYINNDDNKWILDVGVLVVDEAHLLATNRGAALEVGLMRFTEYNPNAKVILLSATMTNADRIGSWLESLNKKQTKVISTEWRPVDLDHHYVRTMKSEIVGERIKSAQRVLNILFCPFSKISSYLTSPDPLEREVAQSRIEGLKSSQSKDAHKTLVFVHGKEEGRKLCSLLDGAGFKVSFHCADLDKSARNKLEKQFKGDELDVLIATSTLAWGINMPARNVIILGNKRGPTEVDDMDIKQMIGRAGRFGMYDKGDAYIICNRRYELSSEFQITSKLNDNYTLMFHLVAEVYSGNIKTHADAYRWYSRSFAAATNKYFEEDLDASLGDLLLCEALILEDGIYRVTPYGKIARDLYINPMDIHYWRTNLNKLSECGEWKNEADMAWALTNGISTLSMSYIPKELQRLTGDYQRSCSDFCKPMRYNNTMYGGVVYYRLMRSRIDAFQQRSLDASTMQLMQMILRDGGRMFGAIKRLDQLEQWHRGKTIIALQARIMYGVDETLLELVSIPGVGEAIAKQLYAAGLKTLEDVKNNKDNLDKFLTRKANITKVLSGLRELEDSPDIVVS